MASNGSSRLHPGLVIAMAVGVLMMVALAVTALIEATEHHNKINDAQTHENIATMFQSAEDEGKAASNALQQYVATGDATLIDQSTQHTQAGVAQLTSAIQLLGSDPGDFQKKGQQMVTASGQVVALRQTGDTGGAAQLLTDLAPSFNSFIAAQDQVIADQHQQALDARSSADTAKKLTFWLAVLAGVTGIGLAIGGVYAITRSPRRVAGTASA
jgi:CHASE3 domain sensor protein